MKVSSLRGDLREESSAHEREPLLEDEEVDSTWDVNTCGERHSDRTTSESKVLRGCRVETVEAADCRFVDTDVSRQP